MNASTRFPFPDNSVLVHEPARGSWLLFRHPERVHVAHDLVDVLPALRAAEADVRRGRYAAGFVAYEAGPAFDKALVTHPASGFPLVWLGIFQHPEPFDLPPPAAPPSADQAWTASISRSAYDRGFARIKDHIAAGDTYQVNYTLRLRAAATFTPWDLFLNMIRGQGPGYGAYCQLPDFILASASPEMFFERNGRHLVSRPMKGTAARGLTAEEDAALADWLAHSEKNRAENVMIVDMVRNDMGRVAALGSVRVPALWAIERYPTVWQMTSTVTSETDVDTVDIFGAMFPPASITGAPKARAMAIINEVENTPRHIYTGAIGFLAPERRAQFSVAIRTVLVDRRHQLAEYGTGGGIVWDSEGQSEYDECLTKARILTQTTPECDLLETMLWTPDAGYFLLERHLARLHASANYFGMPCERAEIRAALDSLAQTLPPLPHRVRLILPAFGEPVASAQILQRLPQPYRLGLAPAPVSAGNRFLYHKTTCRQIYDEALAARPDCDDVLLWNEAGEVTESCIANVVVSFDGRLATPPVRCGLLPGIYRARLLEEGQIEERVIRLDDLPRADGLFLINSARRMWSATLALPAGEPAGVSHGT